MEKTQQKCNVKNVIMTGNKKDYYEIMIITLNKKYMNENYIYKN